ncbi:hypothetical protein BSL78_05795 [Apostichopus japonicus]|uniref:Uncharacterized protein n=1 Tax=Stichopus japonicus TaxID=307972 RepID=A0A2G8LAJ8_STIJA|nr:hypothetical protein BSL78_05795 [Apostichopus japonicus]
MTYDDSSKELRPRGEPSRRGRGTFTGMRGRGRGSRGGGGGGRGSRDGYYSNRDDNRGSRRDEGAMMRPTVWNNSEADESSEKSERGTPQENDGNKETKLNEMEGEETSDFRRTRNSYSDGMDRSRRGTRGGRHPGQRQPPKPRPQRPEKPPRFQKVNGRGRGRGNPRHGDGRMDSLGRGRSRDGGAPGSSLSSGERTPPRVGRPTLVKQSSSEHNNEEWETASESSDFNDRRGGDETKENNGDYSDPERQPGDTEGATSNGPKPYDKGKDEQGLRGSHRDDRKSRQGPSRSGPGRPAGRAANDDRRSGKSKYDDRRNTNMDNKAKRDGKVFRMDQVHLSNPGSVQDALNKSSSQKKPLVGSHGKPTPIHLHEAKEKERARAEQERKKEFIQNYDLNNIASIVMVDNMPEVIKEDPEDLLTPGEGFQEVKSKRAQRQEAERRRLDTSVLDVIKPKLGTSMKRGHSSKQQARLTKPVATGLSNGGPVIASLGDSPVLNRAPGSRPNIPITQQPAGMTVSPSQQVNVSMNNSVFGEDIFFTLTGL